jgi:AraC-like DNA-binding protein
MTQVDRLTALLDRFRVETSLFHAGPLCGVTSFDAQPGRGFLHLLRRGDLEVAHPDAGGRMLRLRVERPSLIFYPRPVPHTFYNAPVDGSDFACAALDFVGGATHPIVRALPAVMIVPLDDVDNLAPALDLLFAEVDNIRCGQRLVADRLFEVVLIQLLRWMLDHADELSLPAGLFPGLADPQLALALVAVHEAPGEEWSLERMARTARLSRSAFAARFKERVGMTPGEYLTGWRLTIAQERLRAGMPVSTVAVELGYATASSFSRVFAQHLGRSPRDWTNAVAA